MAAAWRFWIDRGGTFTDVVAARPDGTVDTMKLLSVDPDRYDDAAIEGIRRMMDVPPGEPLPVEHIAEVRMGTTVATNALLERTGEPTVLVTTTGLADAARIAYQNRPDIFARAIRLPQLLHDTVIEADRATGTGNDEPVIDNAAEVRAALRRNHDAGYRSVAVCLMHAYADGAAERLIGRWAEEIGYHQISLSHEVSPLIKLVSRTDTTVVDAYLSPILRSYVAAVTSRLPGVPVLFMRSSGGLTEAHHFRGKDSILSGPAGGIVGMARTAQAAGFDAVIGFDMGGTSTDVSRFAGEFERGFDAEVGGVRLRAPMLRIHTVAAGGGSILHFDGSRYRVGPDSAGADPGPAAYRRGGPLTVTDANVMLGRIHPEHFPAVFGPDGDAALDVEAVRDGFTELATRIDDGRTPEEVAAGFLRIAVSNMADAIKQISVQRGHDVTEHVLSTFGGAGGQHACAVADALGMTTVLIHPRAGVLSAYGMGLADITATREQAVDTELDEECRLRATAVAEELTAEATAELTDQGIDPADTTAVRRVHLKYLGTDTTVPVELAALPRMTAAFEQRYRELFSFLMPERPVVLDSVSVEVVARARVAAEPESDVEATDEPPIADRVPMHCGEWLDAPLYRRAELRPGHRITGPAIVAESGSTTIVDPGWRARVTGRRHLVLERVTARRDETVGTAVDPVRLELFNNLFMSVAEQMGNRLRATANSVNIKERLDFSCAVFDGQGRLVANAPHMPVHLGSMDDSITTVLSGFGNRMRPGDSYLVNNPYAGGTHLPDITVVTPVFDPTGSDLLFFVAARGHHAEIGGITPGSMPADSRRIEEEGVLIEARPLARDGALLTDEIRALLTGAAHPSRSPEDNLADLRAQLSATRKGVTELRNLVDHFGLDAVRAYMGHVRHNAAEAVRRVIDRLDDGQYRYRTDSDAVIAVRVTVDRAARTARIDFTGTAPQRDDNFNAPSSVAMAAVLYVFRTLVADDIPLNSGCLDPIEVVIPPGTMLSPAHPAAVVAGNVETSQGVVGALYAALGAQAEGSGTMNNLTFGNDTHQYYETVASGSAAGPDFDGTDAVQTHMTNSRITDPEVMERRFPVRVETFAIRRGSGGAGYHRGGDGVIRRLRFDEPMTVSLLSRHRVVPPYGMAGGEPGALGDQWVERADGTRDRMRGCDSVQVNPGDIVVLATPGGGGYGKMTADVAHRPAQDRGTVTHRPGGRGPVPTDRRPAG